MVRISLPNLLTSSTNGVKVDVAIVRADQHQGSVSATTNSLRNQGIHVEIGLIKMRHQLGIPPADAEHNVAKSPFRGGQRCQLSVLLQHLLNRSRLLLLI
jgi:hypothetical protein